MSRHTRSKQNRRSRNAKALRRAVVGLIASAGAFLAFGMTPLAMPPSAHADEFELIVDPIINSISSIDPALGTDLTAGLANLDSALAGAAAFDPSSAAGSLGALSNPFDTWLHGLEQDWINSPLGQQVDSASNAWFAQADPSAVSADDPTAGACGLICNGANGLPGTGENGQGGGLLLGDGGAGGSGAPGTGGNGGLLLGPPGNNGMT